MAIPTNAQIDAMESPGPAQLLKLVNIAIAEILLKGVTVMADGAQKTRADLRALYDWRDRLLREVAADSDDDTNDGTVLAAFGNPPRLY